MLTYLTRLLGVWLLTWVAQRFVTRDYFIRHPKVYQCLMLFYWSGFGITFLADISRVESQHASNFAWTLGYALFNVHHYLIADLIEDFIYRDLKCFGGLWHNWGTYGSPLAVTVQILVLSQLISAHPFGALRGPSISIKLQQGTTPFVWPRVTTSSIGNRDLFPYVLAANLTFSTAGLYYLTRWRLRIDAKKSK